MKRKVLYLIMCFFAIASASAQSISIVGTGVNGWPPTTGPEITLNTTDNITYTIIGLTVSTGEVKFRQDASWDINWGSSAWPSGIGTQGGANIPTIAGTYDVTFNRVTGEYTFGGGPPVPVVKLVGSAVPDAGGLTLNTTDAETYRITDVTLVDGNAQFQIDADFYGAVDFPTGSLADNTLSIPVPAGDYSLITLNIASGEYAFTTAPIYEDISIVGSGVGGWPGEAGNPGPVDVNQMTTTDGITYTLNNLTVTAGEAKFRQNNGWAVAWGATTFPTGTGDSTPGSPNIPTTAGIYNVTFNRVTGAYVFSFPTIAIVGAGVGGWPGEPGNPGPVDVNQLSTTDGVNYTLTGLVAVGGEAKFRQGNAWDTAWGATTFPSGTGDITPGSPNIPVAAGTYDLSFNKTTGAYNFALLATKGFSTSNFKVYPNPTQNEWNFTSAKEAIQSVQIVDVLGKSIMTVTPKSTTVNVDASSLNAGIYFAKIATATATETIKLVRN